MLCIDVLCSPTFFQPLRDKLLANDATGDCCACRALHPPQVMEKLEALFEGFQYAQPPPHFVFLGNFSSSPITHGVCACRHARIFMFRSIRHISCFVHANEPLNLMENAFMFALPMVILGRVCLHACMSCFALLSRVLWQVVRVWPCFGATRWICFQTLHTTNQAPWRARNIVVDFDFHVVPLPSLSLTVIDITAVACVAALNFGKSNPAADSVAQAVARFDSLCKLILKFPDLASSAKFVFVPGPQDPGAGDTLPRPPVRT